MADFQKRTLVIEPPHLLRFGTEASDDVTYGKTAANIVTVTGGETITGPVTSNTSMGVAPAANGSSSTRGVATELLTLAAAATTDSTANLLPANSIIESVCVFVATVIPTAATFTVGDSTIAARFATGVAVAAGTAAVGLTHIDQTGTSGPRQTAAAKVRITPNLTPGTATGQVRIVVYYKTFVAPTS